MQKGTHGNSVILVICKLSQTFSSKKKLVYQVNNTTSQVFVCMYAGQGRCISFSIELVKSSVPLPHQSRDSLFETCELPM